MSKISKTFKKYKKVFIPYITVGDVPLPTTAKLVIEMSRAGAHLIELGVPFSDPLADGPTIQAASQRALKRGVTLLQVFDLVKDIRKKTAIPLILMSYYNPIYKFGVKNFATLCNRVGVDGVIVPDLPPEEAKGFGNLDTIFLIAPTSSDTRIKLISKACSGFIYCVSVIGITGAREKLSTEIKGLIKRVRTYTDKPIVVGFGISKREHVREIFKFADGVVVGSALLDVINRHRGRPDLVNIVGDFLRGLL
jgi:tryptophan synthase alpha chain